MKIFLDTSISNAVCEDTDSGGGGGSIHANIRNVACGDTDNGGVVATFGLYRLSGLHLKHIHIMR